MAEVKLTEDGRLINVETGEEFGRNENGRIVIDSTGSVGRTLDETGVSEPEETEEEYYEAMIKAGYPTGKTEYDGIDSVSHDPEKKNEKAPSADDPNTGPAAGAKARPVSLFSGNAHADRGASARTHVDSGPTSFNVKRSKYEVTPDTFFIVRFGLTIREDGGFYAINVNAAKDNPEVEEHWVKFRMWTYDEELKWKSDCLEFNAQSKTQYINIEKLNECKIKCLLLDWSFAEHDERLKLLHCDGRLSDESYSLFCGLYPVIANSIVELMNSVLENG